MSNKTALITGVTGQDGSYLSELLLEKGYKVHGIKRRSSSLNTDRVDHLYDNPNFKLHYGDLSDSTNLIRIIQEVKPDEIYNLAAMSHVAVSFEEPEYTADVDGLGTLRLLEAIRILGLEKKTKFYQASTSELFGKVLETPQKETTPFYPRSPYGIAKQFAYWTCINYREAYNMFACNGILFNHESPRRGETFVTRKITIGVSKIYNGLQKVLELGNLDAKRDWGHAKDYCEAMYLMMQQEKPDDFVIATGQTTTVREFVKCCFEFIGVVLKFQGSGVNEVGVVDVSKDNTFKKGQILVKVNPKYFRPTEVDLLLGDATKAKNILNWKPKTSLLELVEDMMISDLKLFEKNRDYV